MRCRPDNPTPGCCSSEPIARKREPPIVDSAAGYWQRCPSPLAIPRPPIAPGAIKIRRFGSTVSTWKRRGLRSVVTLEPFQQDRQQLLCTIEKLKTRVQILAAAVRLLHVPPGFVSQASGFPRATPRRASCVLSSAHSRPCPFVSFSESSACQLRATTLGAAFAVVCGLDDRSPCPRTVPAQLTAVEVATIKDMVLAPELRHMPLRTLSLYAQRVGRVFASATTWARLIRERGWRRPRFRVHAAKPTVGIRASAPNETWHIDVSVLKLLDGTKAYIHAIIDNFSRKILAWTIGARLDPSATCRVLVEAGQHLVQLDDRSVVALPQTSVALPQLPRQSRTRPNLGRVLRRRAQHQDASRRLPRPDA